MGTSPSAAAARASVRASRMKRSSSANWPRMQSPCPPYEKSEPVRARQLTKTGGERGDLRHALRRPRLAAALRALRATLENVFAFSQLRPLAGSNICQSTSKQVFRLAHQTKTGERGGFEPPGHSRAQRFSRPPHSTALPSLHALGNHTIVGPEYARHHGFGNGNQPTLPSTLCPRTHHFSNRRTIPPAANSDADASVITSACSSGICRGTALEACSRHAIGHHENHHAAHSDFENVVDHALVIEHEIDEGAQDRQALLSIHSPIRLGRSRAGGLLLSILGDLMRRLSTKKLKNSDLSAKCL